MGAEQTTETFVEFSHKFLSVVNMISSIVTF